MKKCILILLLTLLTTWLLPACTPQPEAQDPTMTPTTTAPATTAAPPVTTAPPETTEPEDGFYSDSYMQAQGFEFLYDIASRSVWQYTGENSTISLPHCGLNIALPEGWAGNVSIYWYQYEISPASGHLYIASNAILDAHHEVTPCVDYCSDWVDCLLHIWYGPISEMNEQPGLIGHNDAFYVCFATPDLFDPECSEELLSRTMLIKQIGQETYDELVGDLVCTQEMAREMITVTEADPDLAYQP